MDISRLRKYRGGYFFYECYKTKFFEKKVYMMVQFSINTVILRIYTNYK